MKRECILFNDLERDPLLGIPLALALMKTKEEETSSMLFSCVMLSVVPKVLFLVHQLYADCM
jgi:hypothetical protein